MNFLRAIAYSLLLKEKHDAKDSNPSPVISCVKHGWENCIICRLNPQAPYPQALDTNHFIQSIRSREAYSEAARSYLRKRS